MGRQPTINRFGNASGKGGLFRRVWGRQGGAHIQNEGVDRMSGMSSILCILLYREVPSPHEPK